MNDCKQNRAAFGDARGATAGALYVHVPFCLRKCGYCDFYSRPLDPALDPALARAYLRALERDAQMHAPLLHRPLSSAYVGGGTPTSLGPEGLAELLHLLAPLTRGTAEFSVEANPATCSPAIARTLRAGGVNRVTLGVQSMVTAERRTLDRAVTAPEIRSAVRTLREAGLENLGADLIYAIPGQTLATWDESLRRTIDLGIEHLSCYALEIEPDTPLGSAVERGDVRELGEDAQADLYAHAVEVCQAAGLERYEISNFARPARQSRHNLTYWHNEAYVGLGPAAASFLAGARIANLPDLPAYIAALDAHQPPPRQSERLGPRDAMAEALMLGLRLTAGVDRAEFARRYGEDPVAAFPRTVRRWASAGALRVTDARLHIAPEALFTANCILADFLAEAGDEGSQAAGNGR